ncbi:hypothetical protein ACJX0J_013231, partial [Zea mays]
MNHLGSINIIVYIYVWLSVGCGLGNLGINSDFFDLGNLGMPDIIIFPIQESLLFKWHILLLWLAGAAADKGVGTGAYYYLTKTAAPALHPLNWNKKIKITWQQST